MLCTWGSLGGRWWPAKIKLGIVLIPKEYFTEGGNVVADGYKIGFGTMASWDRELIASGSKSSNLPAPICQSCNHRIGQRHLLLWGKHGQGNVRLHQGYYRKEVNEMARVLFAKGRGALSGSAR